jgi:competence protein ComEC
MRVFLLYSVSCCFLLGAALQVLTQRDQERVPDDFIPLVNTEVELGGVVVRMPDQRETSTRVTVRILQGTKETNIIARVSRYQQIAVGDLVRVQGVIARPEPFITDGGRTFAYDDFLLKDGVTLLMPQAHMEIVGESGEVWLQFLRRLSVLRAWFSHSLTLALPEPESALASGIIVGGKQGLGEELLDAFTVAGMLQLVVLSGYNVAIVADGVLRMLGFLPKKLAAGVAALTIVCFVLAAGAGHQHYAQDLWPPLPCMHTQLAECTLACVCWC